MWTDSLENTWKTPGKHLVFSRNSVPFHLAIASFLPVKYLEKAWLKARDRVRDAIPDEHLEFRRAASLIDSLANP